MHFSPGRKLAEKTSLIRGGRALTSEMGCGSATVLIFGVGKSRTQVCLGFPACWRSTHFCLGGREHIHQSDLGCG